MNNGTLYFLRYEPNVNLENIDEKGIIRFIMENDIPQYFASPLPRFEEEMRVYRDEQLIYDTFYNKVLEKALDLKILFQDNPLNEERRFRDDFFDHVFVNGGFLSESITRIKFSDLFKKYSYEGIGLLV